MKIGPLELCWADLGGGKVCERLSDHEPPCSADPTLDFPVTSSVRHQLDEVASTGFSAAGIRTHLAKLAEWADDSPAWNCPHCDTPASHNPNDIAAHYCGFCHHYCDDIP